MKKTSAIILIIILAGFSVYSQDKAQKTETSKKEKLISLGVINIGHNIISRSVLTGLYRAVEEMQEAIKQ